MVYIFPLDAKNEEKVKKILKISLVLPRSLLANASGRVEFYTPEFIAIDTCTCKVLFQPKSIAISLI